jgi:molybdate transport system substrate-binding protein
MFRRRSGFSTRRARRRFGVRAALIGLLAAAGALPQARAEEVTIAVAANFRGALETLAAEFEDATGHRVTITSGSTGQLYAQIVNGAPFDILLAADRERPRLLAEAGLGEPSSVFSYAVGRLALWSRDPGLVDAQTLSSLGEIPFRWFAIAEPDVAPYGAAAKQALERLGAWESIEPRLVRGLNIAQAFAMIETRNAELGLVALSQALAYEGTSSYEIVPSALHDPIRQDAIALRRAADNTAASAFLDFIRTSEAGDVLQAYGYATSPGPGP